MRELGRLLNECLRLHSVFYLTVPWKLQVPYRTLPYSSLRTGTIFRLARSYTSQSLVSR
jgi:hypothetical protein